MIANHLMCLYLRVGSVPWPHRERLQDWIMKGAYGNPQGEARRDSTSRLVEQSDTKNELCLHRVVDEWQEVTFFVHDKDPNGLHHVLEELIPCLVIVSFGACHAIQESEHARRQLTGYGSKE